MPWSPCCQSYDVFDTLLARIGFEPVSVFEKVAMQVPHIPNFVDLRRQSEAQADGTFDGIYCKFAELAKLSQDEALRIQKLEFDAEKDSLFAIAENMKKVQDGDVLVSDMYLPKERIVELLNKCGLDKDVHVFVSSGGKHQGWIWKLVLERHNIQCHTGDNEHSDVHMPLLHGVPKTVHSTLQQFSPEENAVVALGARELALVMRYTRLHCSYDVGTPEHSVWSICSNLTLPSALIGSIVMDRYARKMGIVQVILPSEPVLWTSLHKGLYPDGPNVFGATSEHTEHALEIKWFGLDAPHQDPWIEAFGPVELSNSPVLAERTANVAELRKTYTHVAADACFRAMLGAQILRVRQWPWAQDDKQLQRVYDHFVAACNL